MELKGKIDDYGIADIFQLIGQQRRSGILTVRSGKNVSEIYVVQGMISRAHPAYRSPRNNPLGECAVKSRLINEKNLENALGVQEQTLKTLEELFLEMKFIDQYGIQKLGDFLSSETLYHVLQWRSGEYDFTMKNIDHDDRFYDLVSVDHILLDILRMIDEEPELLRRIPNFNIVFQKAPAADDQEIDLLPFEDDEGEVTYEEIVYGFVNGRNRVIDIINQSLLGRYHTLNALVGLIDGGLITKTTLSKVETKRPAVPRNRLRTYLSYIVLPAVLISFVVLKVAATDFPTPGQIKESFAFLNLKKTNIPRVKNALNVYYLGKDTYPDSLDALVDSGILDKIDPISPNNPAFDYKLINQYSYLLE